jgi:hypothetical protein
LFAAGEEMPSWRPNPESTPRRRFVEWIVVCPVVLPSAGFDPRSQQKSPAAGLRLIIERKRYGKKDRQCFFYHFLPQNCLFLKRSSDGACRDF